MSGSSVTQWTAHGTVHWTSSRMMVKVLPLPKAPPDTTTVALLTSLPHMHTCRLPRASLPELHSDPKGQVQLSLFPYLKLSSPALHKPHPIIPSFSAQIRGPYTDYINFQFSHSSHAHLTSLPCFVFSIALINSNTSYLAVPSYKHKGLFRFVDESHVPKNMIWYAMQKMVNKWINEQTNEQISSSPIVGPG